MFDPYHEWLGLPREQRPPTYYQLLGIAANESNAAVIDEAALHQTARIRIYQTGVHAEACTRLLNEIAEARTVLGHPVKRRDYDAHVSRTGRGQPTVNPLPGPVEGHLQTCPIIPAVLVGRTKQRRLEPFAMLYVLLLLLGATLLFWMTSVERAHQPRPRSSPPKASLSTGIDPPPGVR